MGERYHLQAGSLKSFLAIANGANRDAFTPVPAKPKIASRKPIDECEVCIGLPTVNPKRLSIAGESVDNHAKQGACVRRRSWAGCTINMFEFEFPTGTGKEWQRHDFDMGFQP
jgi:hypothetical protein